MRHLRTVLLTVLVLGLVCHVWGCGSDGDSSEAAGDGWPANTAEAIANYSVIVEASYADSHATAVTLNNALKALVATPTQDTLDTARQAWYDSREPYLETEVYRFYEGPIDNEADGPEGLINAWPMDEHTVDYVEGDAAAGIINGTDTLDANAIEAANGADGEADVKTGYHAIEFLLWGQDQSDDGPGSRPYTDYVVSENGPSGCYSGPPNHTCSCGGAEADCAAPGMWTDTCACPANADRRGTYLTIVGDLLVSHLETVHAAWAAGGTNYRADFEVDSQVAFEKILTGMIVLAGFETGGERLQAARDSGLQEDEHSCFSDNTHRDMVQDVQGIHNVWNGTYERVDGTVVSGVGIKDVVTAKDADLAARVDAKINEALANAQALVKPFDQEIAPGNAEGNARVDALIDSLTNKTTGLEAVLFEVFDAFGLSITIPE